MIVCSEVRSCTMTIVIMIHKSVNDPKLISVSVPTKINFLIGETRHAFHLRISDNGTGSTSIECLLRSKLDKTKYFEMWHSDRSILM